ncbi:uncharacterized protein LOC144066092 [Stigmatopora argus]
MSHNPFLQFTELRNQTAGDSRNPFSGERLGVGSSAGLSHGNAIPSLAPSYSAQRDDVFASRQNDHGRDLLATAARSSQNINRHSDVGDISVSRSSSFGRPAVAGTSSDYSKAPTSGGRPSFSVSGEDDGNLRSIPGLRYNPPDMERTPEPPQPKYTPESAADVLVQFGLEKEDLEHLISFPEDQITPESLPFILRQIRIQKAKKVSNANHPKLSREAAPDRNKDAWKGPGLAPKDASSSRLQSSEVIDYGHVSKYEDAQGRAKRAEGDNFLTVDRSCGQEPVQQVGRNTGLEMSSSDQQKTPGSFSVSSTPPKSQEAVNPALAILQSIFPNFSLLKKDTDLRDMKPPTPKTVEFPQQGPVVPKPILKPALPIPQRMGRRVHPTRPDLVVLGENDSEIKKKPASDEKPEEKQKPSRWEVTKEQQSQEKTTPRPPEAKETQKPPKTKANPKQASEPQQTIPPQPLIHVPTYVPAAAQQFHPVPTTLHIPNILSLPPRPLLGLGPSPGGPQEQATAVAGFPTAVLMRDYAAATPKVFPHLCTLCNNMCVHIQDWVAHQNTNFHLVKCKLLRERYPQWNGEVLPSCEVTPDVAASAPESQSKISQSTSSSAAARRHRSPEARRETSTRRRSRSRSPQSYRYQRRSRSDSSSSSEYGHSRSRSYERRPSRRSQDGRSSSRRRSRERPAYTRRRSSSRSFHERRSVERSRERWSTERNRERRSPERRSERRSPERSSERRSPERRSERRSPERRSERRSPERRSERRSPEKRSERRSPERRSERRSPERRSERRSPERSRERRSPERSRERRSPERRNERRSPERNRERRSPPKKTRGGTVTAQLSNKADRLAKKLMETSAVQSLSKQTDLESMVKTLAPALLAELAKMNSTASKSQAETSKTAFAANKKPAGFKTTYDPKKKPPPKPKRVKTSDPTMVTLNHVKAGIVYKDLAYGVEAHGKTKSIIMFRNKEQAVVRFHREEDADKLREKGDIRIKDFVVNIQKEKDGFPRVQKPNPRRRVAPVSKTTKPVVKMVKKVPKKTKFNPTRKAVSVAPKAVAAGDSAEMTKDAVAETTRDGTGAVLTDVMVAMEDKIHEFLLRPQMAELVEDTDFCLKRLGQKKRQMLISNLPLDRYGYCVQDIIQLVKPFGFDSLDESIYVLPQTRTAFVQLEEEGMVAAMDAWKTDKPSLKEQKLDVCVLKENIPMNPKGFYDWMMKRMNYPVEERYSSVVFIKGITPSETNRLRQALRKIGGVQHFLPLHDKVFVKFQSDIDADCLGLWYVLHNQCPAYQIARLDPPQSAPIARKSDGNGRNLKWRLKCGSSPSLQRERFPTKPFPIWHFPGRLLRRLHLGSLNPPQFLTVQKVDDIENAIQSGASPTVMLTNLSTKVVKHEDVAKLAWPYFSKKDLRSLYYNVMVLPLQRRAFVHFSDWDACRQFVHRHLDSHKLEASTLPLRLHLVLESMSAQQSEEDMYVLLMRLSNSRIGKVESLAERLLCVEMSLSDMDSITLLLDFISSHGEVVNFLPLANRICVEMADSAGVARVLEASQKISPNCHARKNILRFESIESLKKRLQDPTGITLDLKGDSTDRSAKPNPPGESTAAPAPTVAPRVESEQPKNSLVSESQEVETPSVQSEQPTKGPGSESTRVKTSAEEECRKKECSVKLATLPEVQTGKEKISVKVEEATVLVSACVDKESPPLVGSHDETVLKKEEPLPVQDETLVQSEATLVSGKDETLARSEATLVLSQDETLVKSEDTLVLSQDETLVQSEATLVPSQDETLEKSEDTLVPGKDEILAKSDEKVMEINNVLSNATLCDQQPFNMDDFVTVDEVYDQEDSSAEAEAPSHSKPDSKQKKPRPSKDSKSAKSQSPAPSRTTRSSSRRSLPSGAVSSPGRDSTKAPIKVKKTKDSSQRSPTRQTPATCEKEHLITMGSDESFQVLDSVGDDQKPISDENPDVTDGGPAELQGAPRLENVSHVERIEKEPTSSGDTPTLEGQNETQRGKEDADQDQTTDSRPIIEDVVDDPASADLDCHVREAKEETAALEHDDTEAYQVIDSVEDLPSSNETEQNVPEAAKSQDCKEPPKKQARTTAKTPENYLVVDSVLADAAVSGRRRSTRGKKQEQTVKIPVKDEDPTFQVLDSVEEDAGVNTRASRKRGRLPKKDGSSEEKSVSRTTTPSRTSPEPAIKMEVEPMEIPEPKIAVPKRKGRKGRPKKDAKKIKIEKNEPVDEEEAATFQVLDSVEDETGQVPTSTGETQSSPKREVVTDGMSPLNPEDEEEPTYQVVDSLEEDPTQEETEKTEEQRAGSGDVATRCQSKLEVAQTKIEPPTGTLSLDQVSDDEDNFSDDVAEKAEKPKRKLRADKRLQRRKSNRRQPSESEMVIPRQEVGEESAPEKPTWQRDVSEEELGLVTLDEIVLEQDEAIDLRPTSEGEQSEDCLNPETLLTLDETGGDEEEEEEENDGDLRNSLSVKRKICYDKEDGTIVVQVEHFEEDLLISGDMKRLRPTSGVASQDEIEAPTEEDADGRRVEDGVTLVTLDQVGHVEEDVLTCAMEEQSQGDDGTMLTSEDQSKAEGEARRDVPRLLEDEEKQKEAVSTEQDTQGALTRGDQDAASVHRLKATEGEEDEASSELNLEEDKTLMPSLDQVEHGEEDIPRCDVETRHPNEGISSAEAEEAASLEAPLEDEENEEDSLEKLDKREGESFSESPIHPAAFPLPPFNPKKPFGTEFIVPKSGFFCDLCSIFYLKESTAKEVHCKSRKHYNNIKKYYSKREKNSSDSARDVVPD